MIDLHIRDSGGSGRPVVLIHGWPLSGASWEPQVAPLRDAGYRVVAYDRRGFGHSDKPEHGYDYDTLAGDLHDLLEAHDLRDVTLVGFSMGGGEVARYVSRHGEDRLHSVVFAAAVPPYLMKGDDNPDGPLTHEAWKEMEAGLESDREGFLKNFSHYFFSVDGDLKVTEAERKSAEALALQSSQTAALGCMEAWATTDFREDLEKITVPCLVLHGTTDEVVPLEGSGQRTHGMVKHSKLVTLDGAPHGCNVSHKEAFNSALLDFLKT